MAKELNINVRLSREQAKRDAEALRRDMQGVNRQMAKDAEDAAKQGSEATVKLWRDANGKLRQESGRTATDAQKAAAGITDGYDKVASKIGLVVAGLGAAKMMADTFAEAVAKTQADAERLAATFSKLRDQERERAAATGGQASGRAVLESLRFARAAAMTPEEAKSFRTSFANEAQAYAGNLSEADFKQYQLNSARMAIRSGAGPDEAARFASAFIDRKTTAAAASAEQFKISEIYGAGAGSAAQNFEAFARLRSQFVPSATGAFRSNEELAIVGSVANALGAVRQEESVADLARALRDPKNKQLQSLYAQTGVAQNASVMETIKAIGPALMARSKAENRGLDQILAEYIPDSQPRRSLAAQISLGLGAGQYEQRRGVADRAGAAGRFDSAIGEFMAAPNTVERQAQADVALAEAEKAAKSEDLNVLRKQAAANLLRSGATGTTAGEFNKFLNQKMSFGLIGGAEQKAIDDEAQRMVVARAGAQGLTLQRDFLGGIMNFTPEAREDELNRMIGQFRAAGKDPFAAAGNEVQGLDLERGGGVSFIGRQEKFRPGTLPDLDARRVASPAPTPLVPRPEVKNR